MKQSSLELSPISQYSIGTALLFSTFSSQSRGVNSVTSHSKPRIGHNHNLGRLCCDSRRSERIVLQLHRTLRTARTQIYRCSLRQFREPNSHHNRERTAGCHNQCQYIPLLHKHYSAAARRSHRCLWCTCSKSFESFSPHPQQRPLISAMFPNPQGAIVQSMVPTIMHYHIHHRKVVRIYFRDETSVR